MALYQKLLAIHVTYSPILFRVASLELRQSDDCPSTGLIPGLWPANERCRYKITLSLAGRKPRISPASASEDILKNMDKIDQYIAKTKHIQVQIMCR